MRYRDMFMKVFAAVSVLLVTGAALAGCQIGDSRGVLPRTTTIAPPPSALNPEQPASKTVPVQRTPSHTQSPTASDQAERSAPEPSIQPVMTGRGAGAGFRF